MPNCKAAGRGPAGVGLGTVPAPVVWSFQADRRRAWRFTPRKTLFFRRQAPRLPGSRRRRRTGRGAPLPAKPCSFVVKHHVFRAQGAADVPDVVPHSPLTLVPSSARTTSSELKAPPAYRTWCLTPRKTLFLRRQAPRLPDPRRRRLAGRGASLPANPCSIVGAHHVFGSEWASGHCHIQKVMHEPLFFRSMHHSHFQG